MKNMQNNPMQGLQEVYQKAYIKYVQQSPLHEVFKNFLTRKGCFEGDFKFYLFYAHLFKDAFEEVTPKDLQQLCVGGFLYYQSLIAIDQLTDQERQRLNLKSYLIISSCQEETVKILSSLFPISSNFWQLWNQRKEEYFLAGEAEKKHCKMSLVKWHELADHKSAFGKVAIDALHVLTQQKSKQVYKALLESHRNFSIGLQLLDDLQDLEEDIKENQFNWVYYQLQKWLANTNTQLPDQRITTLKKHLYLSGLAQKIHQKALQHLKKAKRLALFTKAKLWAKVVSKVELETADRLDTLIGYFEILKTKRKLNIYKHNTRLNLKVIVTPKSQVQVSALKFIIKNQKQGYGELQHIMYLSNLEGFSKRNQIHIGDIFQRAIITDVFCDIQEQGEIDLSKIIKEETDYLISKRLPTRLGGWNYFPSVPEIAPDADDLGQILQVLQRSGRNTAIKQYCQRPLNTLLSDNLLPNGSVETWIVPKKNRTKIQEKQNYFNETKWGKGPDNEVVANLFYGLALYSFEKYKQHILKACTFLQEQQHRLGYWPSKWYYGPYYGTYVCLRLLLYAPMRNEVTQKAFEFLRKHQNANGSWGIKQKGDALNTALALLSLQLGEDKKHKKIIQKGIVFLQQIQEKDGGWSAVDFIQPRVNAPYRSRTLTTAYVLKALTKLKT